MKEKILISACLLGFDCKYDGGNNRMADTDIEALRERFELIPVCPECCGGLPTPRTPSERLGDRVVSKTGADVSEQFKKGARAALGLARHFGIKTAILKANSHPAAAERYTTARLPAHSFPATESRPSF